MTEEALQTTKKTELLSAIKSVQKQLQKCPIQSIFENDKNNISNSKSSSSSSDCKIVAARG